MFAAFVYAQVSCASHGALHSFSFVWGLIYITYAVAIDAAGTDYLPDGVRLTVECFRMRKIF